MQMAADLGIAPEDRLYAAEQILWPTTGTIHVSVVNTKGEMSGATTTSGLAWKLPGRLGDSPILGAGSWTDQDVGSAGATGSGEENIKVVGAHTVVELMRHGMDPKDAGLEVMRRIVRNYNGDMTKVRLLDMEYYIVRKDGAYAGVSLWSTSPTGRPRVFTVADGNGYRVEKCAYLLEGGQSGMAAVLSAGFSVSHRRFTSRQLNCRVLSAGPSSTPPRRPFRFLPCPVSSVAN